MPRIPILTYHQIAEAPPKGARYRSLSVSPAAFARQMRLLRLLGYRGLSMSALQPYLRGEQTGKVVGITFDDGYTNNLVNALPVLQRHGFSSTCYAVSGLVGQTNSWDLEAGIAQTGLMTAHDMRSWLAGGQEIGAHTRTHARLDQLSLEDSRLEIQGSKMDLEALLGVTVAHFCYPYGRFGPVQISQVQAAGFDTATTTERGRATVASQALQLPRVPVMRSTTWPVFLLKLLSTYEDRK
jgi:peptidoglycan/xylan/chitin deacetylase (PgdA/CDA1 family)